MSKQFESLLSDCTRAANNWQSPETQNDAEHVRYNQAATRLFNLAIKKDDRPLALQTRSIHHSVTVLFRACLIAATHARSNAMNKSELYDALMTDSSFDGIASLASSQNRITRRTETEFGLVPTMHPLHDYNLSKSSLDTGGLRFEGVDASIALHKINVEIEHGTQGEGMCGAHKNKILKGLFHCAATICTNDESLFERSLNSLDS